MRTAFDAVDHQKLVSLSKNCAVSNQFNRLLITICVNRVNYDW